MWDTREGRDNEEEELAVGFAPGWDGSFACRRWATATFVAFPAAISLLFSSDVVSCIRCSRIGFCFRW
jgi:hypothetical protein